MLVSSVLAHSRFLLGVPARCGAVRSAEDILLPSLPPSLSSSLLHSLLLFCAWLPGVLGSEKMEFSKRFLQALMEDRRE